MLDQVGLLIVIVLYCLLICMMCFDHNINHNINHNTDHNTNYNINHNTDHNITVEPENIDSSELITSNNNLSPPPTQTQLQTQS